MDLSISEDVSNKRYVATVDGRQAGFAEYIRTDGDLIVLTHTEVDPAFEGQGIGSALAKHILGIARTEERKVLPICSFMSGWIARNPEYQDLSYRGKPSTAKD